MPVPLVLALVITYEAATTVGSVLDRVPAEVADATLRVLVADDASGDDTVGTARAWIDASGRTDVDVVDRPRNLGYGGNQTAGYEWAIEHGVDAVVVLHGDGQYPPERIRDMVGPILRGEADAVFGSRMLIPGGARRGGMPLERWLGNRMLSAFQNRLTGAALSEWHTGLRAYRVSVLAALDLTTLPTGFDYDTAITLRLLDAGARITEVAIPTRYAEEVSHIDLYRTGVRIVGHTLRHRFTGRRAVRGSLRS